MSLTCEPIQKPIRERDEAHRRRVSMYPCVVCWKGRRLHSLGYVVSQTHHIKHAQPRGRSVKVSDCYVIPMCPAHHGPGYPGCVENAGDEAAWWSSHGIDPLPIAAALWAGSQALKPKRKSA